MRALVVDDSRAMRRILGGMLTASGFEVIEACHGGEALDKLHSNPDVDVALVDWNMPVMNGLEFVKAVRSEEGLSGLRLLMVTTETEMERMSEALSAGANEYLMKPFGNEAILDKLSSMGLL